jgi:type I restriction enzyme R subunit
MTGNINESTVEEAALSWFAALGYGVAHGEQTAPGEPQAERESYGSVVLAGRLREAL